MNTERSLYVIPISEKAKAAVTKYWVEVVRYVRGTFINSGVRVNKIYQDSLPNIDYA